MTESNIDITFDPKYKAVKFDDTDIYQSFTKRIPYGKGVDFIAYSSNKVILLEIKNCTGHEKENLWRTNHNSYERSSGKIEDCFDLEVAKK